MKNTRLFAFLYVLFLSFSTWSAQAGQTFSDLVGAAKIGPVQSVDPLEVPFLTWGGDVATFKANGGLTTQGGSTYKNLGLNLKLVSGDDFVGQVKRYLNGDSPFLRGTMRMMGMASEVVGSNPDTKPVIFMQLTWSAGDHMVARETVTTLNDLKGKTVALQQGGPHVGMLDDVLKAAELSWNDINVVFVNELTGPKGPAEKFRQDRNIDAVLVISPDMVGLVGGLNAVGTGAAGSVKAARVLVSTAQMSRSIADVYAVRKDFYNAHRGVVEKFAAGYLKASEDLMIDKKAFETSGSASYMTALKMAQTIYGKEVLPTLEIDAHGLISDATFVGLPGNISFFTDSGNLSGFAAKQKAALDLAVNQGYARGKVEFAPTSLDYPSLASLSKIKVKTVSTKPQARFSEMSPEDLFPDDPIKKEQQADDIILTFTILFEPNQASFSAAKYGGDFQRAVEAASTFGNAVIAIGGHGDPTLMLRQVVEAGIAKGILIRSGSGKRATYTLNGQAFDLKDTPKVLDRVKAGTFSGTSKRDPKDTMNGLQMLSQQRADAVKKAIVDYASGKGYRLDTSQIKPAGVGAREPAVAKPTNTAEARKNMRVEFRLLKVPTEMITSDGFDF